MKKIKLYEFGALVNVAMVVAARSRKEALKALDALSEEGWASIGDKIDITDIELHEVRKLTVPEKDWQVEAHILG